MNDNDKELRSAIKTLFNVASIIKSKQFHDFVLSEDSKINEDVMDVSKILEEKLKYQLDQSHLDIYFSDAVEMELMDGIHSISDQILEAAERLSYEGHQDIPKKERNVSIPKDNSFEFIVKELGHDKLLPANYRLSKYDISLNNKTFGIRNFTSSLADYVLAKDTLMNGVPNHPEFDSLVRETLKKDRDYIAKGYIDDLFVHDRRSIESGDIQGVAMRKDYLSTYGLTEDNKNSFDKNDFQVHNFKSKPSKKVDYNSRDLNI